MVLQSELRSSPYSQERPTFAQDAPFVGAVVGQAAIKPPTSGELDVGESFEGPPLGDCEADDELSVFPPHATQRPSIVANTKSARMPPPEQFANPLAIVEISVKQGDPRAPECAATWQNVRLAPFR
jgi:hypothetical protein